MRCILLSLYVKLYQFGNILVVMHLFWCYQRNRLQGIVAWFRTTRTNAHLCERFAANAADASDKKKICRSIPPSNV
jgi:hypothetical protein